MADPSRADQEFFKKFDNYTNLQHDLFISMNRRTRKLEHEVQDLKAEISFLRRIINSLPEINSQSKSTSSSPKPSLTIISSNPRPPATSPVSCKQRTSTLNPSLNEFQPIKNSSPKSIQVTSCTQARAPKIKIPITMEKYSFQHRQAHSMKSHPVIKAPNKEIHPSSQLAQDLCISDEEIQRPKTPDINIPRRYNKRALSTLFSSPEHSDDEPRNKSKPSNE